MARTPLHELVVGAFLEFSPNVYSLYKELVDIGLKNPNQQYDERWLRVERWRAVTRRIVHTSAVSRTIIPQV